MRTVFFMSVLPKLTCIGNWTIKAIKKSSVLGKTHFPTWITWTKCMTTQFFASENGKWTWERAFPKCKYPHRANNKTLWGVTLHLAFVLLLFGAKEGWACIHAFIFVCVATFLWGLLCLLLLQKNSSPQNNYFD